MNILFMCVANSARSQMAEGLARFLFKNHQFASAGSKPSRVNPLAVAVMNEIGIDLSSHYSKAYEQVSPDILERLDIVITLCADEVCPVVISSAKKLHWPFPDPENSIESFRMVRDLIKARLEQFRNEIENK